MNVTADLVPHISLFQPGKVARVLMGDGEKLKKRYREAGVGGNFQAIVDHFQECEEWEIGVCELPVDKTYDYFIHEVLADQEEENPWGPATIEHLPEYLMFFASGHEGPLVLLDKVVNIDRADFVLVAKHISNICEVELEKYYRERTRTYYVLVARKVS
jgi:hypothetical protein